MESLETTDLRLAVTCQRFPAYSRNQAVLLGLVKHIYKRIHTDCNRFLRRFGLSYPEYDILMIIYGTEDFSLTPTEVAESSGEKPANVTRLTNSLCEKGLIRRSIHHNDRRKVTLTLEPAALELLDKALPEACVQMEAQVCNLSEQENQELEHLLKKMLSMIDNSTDKQ
ncbi:MarR family transcriptional regulator [Xylella fastidiosa subsp. fastidiosa]|jgi:MarR family transcriptional repressor of emrRAB|uniref:Transcriptional regulator MarR family n=2 Tax=Xylella fastidiosa TaxID=2371 RepID=Q87EX0_XYLFT|nr:MarR family transcriptional regulator [Xylella fastidiosa]ADN63167.1 MarR family transcriptional regulator [Xylella fastidiosa subsp. fastidiosa GB514]KAF0571753.1 MarR family transcriptional regulator [Xylella fastidiosa subsp. fastidiosa Mus-1]AAO28069.1 transcriptional regulator MarR family [Xylella fastidiosa Temecula1]ACB91619.1 transcriptional regulator, MarR family [Xylella fastidiosa M23]EGO80916.1 Transcriptional regulator [Xylella fastidiosa EB92.1]